MSPTIFYFGSFRFFFNSREETRMHVHIESPAGSAKFWLEPIVALATYHGLNSKELLKIQSIIEERKDEFISNWCKHFSQ